MMQLRIAVMCVCALLLACPALADVYDDANNGNWTTPGTWGVVGVYPGSPAGGGDTATIDTNIVTLNIHLPVADVASIALGGGTLSMVGEQPARNVYSTISVTAATTSWLNAAHTGSWGAPQMNLYGAISGTGTLTKTGDYGYVYLRTDSPAFTGAWDVQGPNLSPLADGALGRGTVNINSGGSVYIQTADQTAANAPAKVIINDGGELRNNGRNIYGWDIEMNDGSNLTYRGSFRDGTITLSGTCNIYGLDTNTLEIYSTVHGTGTLNFPSGNRYGSVRLRADNYATYSGNILVDVTPDSGNNRRYLMAYEDGALGSGTVTVSGAVAELRLQRSQTAAKAPAAVLISNGARIYNEGATMDGWDVTVDSGSIQARAAWLPTSSFALSGDCQLFSSDGGTADMQSPITGTGTLTILKVASSDGTVRLNADNSGYSGHIIIESNLVNVVDVRHANALGTGTVTVKGGTTRARGALGIGNVAGGFGGDVTLENGGTLTNSRQNATLTSAATITLVGVGQVLCDGAPIWGGDPRTFTLDGKFTGSGALRFECEGDNSDNMIFHLNNTANNYTGGTILDGYYSSNRGGRMQVFATVNGVLGTGTVSILNGRLITDPVLGGGAVADSVFASVPLVDVRNGTLELKSTENEGKIHLCEGGALINTAGNTTITYGAAAGNIHVHEGAILDPSLPLPTAGEIESACAKAGQIYVGTNGLAAGAQYDVAGVVKGLATMDSYPTISGTVSEAAGEGISLYVQDLRKMTLEGAKLISTGELNLEGGGNHGLQNNGQAYCGFVMAGADNLTAAGSVATVNMNARAKLLFDTAGGLPAGLTLNLNDGFLQVSNGAALHDDAVVNINSGGVFKLDTALTSGSIVLKDGGGLWAGAAGLNRVVVEGGQIVLASESGVSGQLPTNGKADFVLYHSSHDEFGGDVVLNADTRLTAVNGPGGDQPRVGSTHKITTVSTSEIGGRIAANPTSPYSALYVFAAVDFPGKTLILGDTGTFNALQREGTGFEDVGIAQDGTVYLSNTNNVMEKVWIQAGRVDINTGGGAASILGRLGNAKEVRVDSPGELYFTDHAVELDTTFSGDGTIIVKLPDARTLRILGNQDAGSHVGTISPGASVGVLTVDGGLAFSRTDLGGGEYENAWVLMDVAKSSGAAGDAYDQIVMSDRGEFANGYGRASNADLKIALPLPSGELNPNTLATVDMDIALSPAGLTNQSFASVGLAPGTDSHWALTDAKGAVTWDTGNKKVILHGSAITWNGFGGDADLNGVVNYLDLGALATNYDLTGMGWGDGDFNFDGEVDYMDLGVLATNYDLTEGSGGANIPEPAALVVLALGTAGLIRRRRR